MLEFFISSRHRSKQTSPRKMNMNFISYSVQFGRKRLNRSLDEKDIGQAPFSWLPLNLLGNLLQRLGICVDADVKFLGVLARTAWS